MKGRKQTMKMHYSGIQADEMLRKVEKEYKVSVLVSVDPYYGEKYETETYVVIDGIHYNYYHDRDGWPVLDEK